ncbi:MAG: ribonuclease R, partial [Lachnospiraceae bacterium]|nr:ribonuclease R [Lachnospiraceae bacterium]
MGEKREIIKEKLYNFICDKEYKPMRLKDIRFLLQGSNEDKKRVEQALEELFKEGKITVTPKGKYKKMDDNLLVGIYIGNKKGYGFVRVEGEKDDYFIPARDSLDAFNSDRVVIMPASYIEPGKRREAKVVEILERGTQVVVGTYDKQGSFGFVIPDNQ